VGNFMGPNMGYNDKRRVLPGVMSDSPRSAQPTRPLPPTASDQNPISTPLAGIDRNYSPIARTMGSGGAGGSGGGAGGTSSPAATAMGNNAAASIGTSGFLNMLSGIPSAVTAHGMGVPGRTIANTMLGNTANAMFGPVGIGNSLLGTALAGYQGSKAATDLNMSKFGPAMQDAFKAISSNFGLAGMIPGMFGHKAEMDAMQAAVNSTEGLSRGLDAYGATMFGGTNPENFGSPFQNAPMARGSLGYSPSAIDAAIANQAIGSQAGASGQAGYVTGLFQKGYQPGQGDPVGGNQGGDPGVGVDYGGGFGEIGSPTGMGEGSDDY
jgi:hypothetical protein